MNWADKLAITWAAFITLCVAFMWIGANQTGELLRALTSDDYFLLLAKLVLPPWLFLRVIAWLFRPYNPRRVQ